MENATQFQIVERIEGRITNDMNGIRLFGLFFLLCVWEKMQDTANSMCTSDGINLSQFDCATKM